MLYSILMALGRVWGSHQARSRAKCMFEGGRRGREREGDLWLSGLTPPSAIILTGRTLKGGLKVVEIESKCLTASNRILLETSSSRAAEKYEV